MSSLIFNIGFFASNILTIIWVILESRKIPKGQSSEETFSGLAKIGVVILCATDPIISGAIFYYSLRKKFPKKARFANWTSIVCFFIELGLFFYVFQLPLTGYVH